MSEEQIADIGSVETQAPVDTASMETGDSSDSGDIQIPKHRFDEVSTKLKDAEERLAGYEGTSTDDLLQVRSESNADIAKVPVDEKALKEIETLKEKFEINEVRARYEDFDNVAKDVATFIKKNPSASWESAYKNVKFDVMAKEARQQGREEAYQSIGEKKQAAGGSPNVHKSQPSNLRKVDSMIADRGSSLTDIEAMLPRS